MNPSLRKTRDAVDSARSFSEQIRWLKNQYPRTPERDWIVITLTQHIQDINADGGYMSVNISKARYKKFLRWCESNEKNK
jgi:hypothetical protein